MGNVSSSPQKRPPDIEQLNDSVWEFYKPSNDPEVEIIFFHGLQLSYDEEGFWKTWLSRDSTVVWPKDWLSKRLINARILSISYDSFVKKHDGEIDPYIITENLIQDIIHGALVGQNCPIVLVGHSFGGIIIKKIILRCVGIRAESNGTTSDQVDRIKNFLGNCRGVFYYSTPHGGSRLGNYAARIPGMNDSFINLLETLSKETARINQRFAQVRNNEGIRTMAIGESKSTKFKRLTARVVEEASARQDVDDFYTAPEANHFDVCKPEDNTTCGIFRHLLSFINERLKSNERVEAKNYALMSDANKSQAIPTSIHGIDSLYVPIEKSQSKVIKAIENSEGCRMVLLHGGLGKGKSTLSRYICQRYGNFGDGGHLFEHVILVLCRNCSICDLPAKQYEILDEFSDTSLRNSQEVVKSSSKSRIAKAFQDCVRGKKMLIILDDVSDKRFLYKMWEATKGDREVKFLITSQRSNLCENFREDTMLIKMEDPSQDEARKILASHVGLEGKDIPHNLQAIVDKMIEATEANPLALACLASNFAYNQDKKNMRDWQEAWIKFDNLLDKKEATIVLQQSDEIAPRSLWDTMKFCIDSLETEDAKLILFLMYACKGESVPEEVLRILHASTKMSRCSFAKSRGELHMRELLRPNYHSLPLAMNLEEDQVLTTWSMMSLVKLHMERYRVDNLEEINKILATLIGNDQQTLDLSVKCKKIYEAKILESEKSQVVIALCALYFDGDHRDENLVSVVTQAKIESNMQDFDSNIINLRRKAIEPLILLLDKPEDNKQWTNLDTSSVRKVLLRYIRKRDLDDYNITHLLRLVDCPDAQVATLIAISHICTLEEAPLLKENNLTFLKTLMHILVAKEDHLIVQEIAFTTLCVICWKAQQDHSTLLVATMPNVLDILISQLSLPTLQSHYTIQRAAHALASLASPRKHILEPIQQKVLSSIKEKIASKEGALASLVKLLYQHDEPTVQIAGAWLLFILATPTENSLKWRIVNEEGALAGLVKLLYEHDKPALQEKGAWALRSLGASTDNSLKWRIINEEGALAGLVKLLYEHDKLTLQEQGAWALRSLGGSTDNSLKWRIVNEEGALAGLVKLLYEHDKPVLQEQGAWTLRNLGGSTENSLKWRIVNEEGALVGLVKLLYEHDKPVLQEQGAWALMCLGATTDNSLKWRIVNEEGALAGLVKLLYEHDKLTLQERGAWALRSLGATTDNSLKWRIFNEEGALNGLVKLLYEQDKPTLQEQGAWALRSLGALTDNSLKWRIVNEEGALAGLVKLLYEQDKPVLQEQGAWALMCLGATTDNSLKWRIVNEEGALAGLVKLLYEHDKLTLQEQGAWALMSLAATTDNPLKWRIVNEEGVLAGLVKFLYEHDKPTLQEQGAWALWSLGGSIDNSLKWRIVNEEGALAGLVKLLYEHDKPTMQKAGASILGCLGATTDDSLKLRVVNEEGALAGLVKLLYEHEKPTVQEEAIKALGNLVDTCISNDKTWKARVVLKEFEGLLEALSSLLLEGVLPTIQFFAAQVLTKIDPKIGKEAVLHSQLAYKGRAHAYIGLGMLREALHNLDQASKLQEPTSVYTLCNRCFVKAKLGDLKGALEDVNAAVQANDDLPLALQERGVLKLMMGDLEGALADLDAALELETDDYERLKHRGYVKFLLKDEPGARADAEWAMRIKPSRVDRQDYGRGPCLGTTPAEYLGYKLK